MKILLDEHFAPRLRHQFPDHEVVTTSYAGWNGLKNGELLTIAEQTGFEVFVTATRISPISKIWNTAGLPLWS